VKGGLKGGLKEELRPVFAAHTSMPGLRERRCSRPDDGSVSHPLWSLMANALHQRNTHQTYAAENPDLQGCLQRRLGLLHDF
jgi:hypothetical protein